MTRSSSSRKERSLKRSSKLSRLRNKLTLKSQTTAAHQQRDNEDEESADIPSSAQVHDPRDNREQTLEVKTKKLFQRASPMKLVRIYPSISPEKDFLIRNYDYGGLLDIKCSKLQPDLCQFVMNSFDPGTCSMVFPGRGSIPVTEISVQEVLGVPLGGLDVVYGSDSDSIRFMKHQLHNPGNKQPTIASLEQKLVRMKHASRKFLRFFIMYAMCSVLAPTTGVRISPRVFPSLVDIKKAKDLNMCKFVIMIICKALSSEGKGDVTPCMLYLMVKYLDSLKLEGIEINEEGTRVSVWTNALIMKAIKQDRRADGSFGAAPLKPEFAADHEQVTEPSVGEEEEPCVGGEGVPYVGEEKEASDVEADEVHSEPGEEFHEGESILFSDPQKIIKFIEKNTPKDRTPEDMARYRESIEYACHGFEASLQVLVRNLATTSANTRSAASKVQVRDSQEIGKEGEATHADDTNAAKVESETSSASDKDFSCDDEDRVETQTTISLEEEDVQLTDTHQERFSTQDERYIRRKKRAKTEDGAASKKHQDAQADGMVQDPTVTGKMCQQPDNDVVLALPCQHTSPIGDTSKGMLLNNNKCCNQIDDQPEPKEHALPSSGAQGLSEQKGKSKIEPAAPTSVEDGRSRCKTGAKGERKNKVEFVVPAEKGTVTVVNPAATEDDVTPKLRFTHLDSKKSDTISSLLRSMRAKQQPPAENVSKQVNGKENVAPHSSKILGTSTTAIKIDDTLAASLNSRRSTSHYGDESFDEETSDTSEETKRRQFLAYVGSSPPGRKFNIPQFEVASVLDFEHGTRAQDVFQSALHDLKPVDMEETSMGLQSFMDESVRKKGEELLAEMVPKVLPTKRKPISCADRKEKKLKNATTIAESPSRYRTRVVVKQETSNSPNKVDNTGDGVAVVNKQPSPAVSASRTRLRNGEGRDNTGDGVAVLNKQQSPAVSGSRMRQSTSSTVTPTTKNSEAQTNNSGPKTMTATVPISAFQDSMNRQLNFDSSKSDILRRKEREAAKKAPDAPPFDLDTPPQDNDQEQHKPGEPHGVSEMVAAGQEGCSNANANPTNSSILPATHGTSTTAIKIDDTLAASLNSRRSTSHYGDESFDEETSDTSEETKRRQFLAYVGSSPPGHKFNIPQFEVASVLDFEHGTRAQDVFQSALHDLKPVDMEETSMGLQSFMDESVRKKGEELLAEMVPKVLPTKRKPISCADRKEKKLKNATTIAESPSRYRTRVVVKQETSNSPNKVDNTGDGVAVVNKQPSPAVSASRTRLRNGEGRDNTGDGVAVLNKQQSPAVSGSRMRQSTSSTVTPTTKNSEAQTNNSGPKTMTATVPISAFQDSMNRQLNFDSSKSDILRRKEREAAKKAPDPPPFDLDTPPQDNDQEQHKPGEPHGVSEMVAAGQEGCSNANANPTNSSILPATHEYDKRVPRMGKFDKSPFLNTEKARSYTVTKNIDNLYNMVCEHGWRRNPKDPNNGKNAVDIENFFVDFGLLGDSVAPRCKLLNTVAECAINFIRVENTNPKKYIMPLRMSRYLIDVRLQLKDVTRYFNSELKLDQKDEICFPTLEKFPGQNSKDPAGHYWLVVLNIKAQRFDIIDSLAANGEPLMMDSCNSVIASIKTLWGREYESSTVQIADWPMELIESPAQTNTYDCGFFMLKNLEERNGRKPATFTQRDLPNIRKLYTDKWLRANKTNEWKQYV